MEIEKPNVKIQCEKCQGFNIKDEIPPDPVPPPFVMTMADFAKMRYEIHGPFQPSKYYRHRLTCLDCGNTVAFDAPYKE
jgi:hypothetical protein